MVTKLELYNKALGHLGPGRLANLKEERGDRYELDAAYAGCCRYMMEQGMWKWALRTMRLDADTDLAPLFGLPNAYTLPDDYVRMRLCCIDERQDIEDKSFTIENDILYSDFSTLYVTIVSNDSAFGMDLGRWPEAFSNAFGAEFAYESGLPITKSGSAKDGLEQKKRLMLTEAKTKDALDERVKFKPPGSWGQSRFRGSRGGMRGRMA